MIESCSGFFEECGANHSGARTQAQPTRRGPQEDAVRKATRATVGTEEQRYRTRAGDGRMAQHV